MGCKDCNYTGWVSEGNAKVECACVIRDRAISYLTPVYASAVYASKFASERYGLPTGQGHPLYEGEL